MTPPAPRKAAVGRTARRHAAGHLPVAEPSLPAALEPADVDDLDDDVQLDEVAIGPGSAAGRTIEGLTLTRSSLSGVRLTGATLEGLELVDVLVEDCDLAGATFTTARFSRVTFRRCRMSGVVATGVVASETRIADTKADEIWLRSARLDRCEIVDCDLTGSDWYDARVTGSLLTGCRLDDSELSALELDDVVLLGSTFAGARGLGGLRNATIGTGQLIEIGLPILAAQGIVVDDAALDPPEADGPDDRRAI